MLCKFKPVSFALVLQICKWIWFQSSCPLNNCALFMHSLTLVPNIHEPLMFKTQDGSLMLFIVCGPSDFIWHTWSYCAPRTRSDARIDIFMHTFHAVTVFLVMHSPVHVVPLAEVAAYSYHLLQCIGQCVFWPRPLQSLPASRLLIHRPVTCSPHSMVVIGQPKCEARCTQAHSVAVVRATRSVQCVLSVMHTFPTGHPHPIFLRSVVCLLKDACDLL